ncbi:MFS 1 [Kluyveromyces marxianus]|nr:MFS 1 [Kluyveromyces marxianus]
MIDVLIGKHDSRKCLYEDIDVTEMTVPNPQNMCGDSDHMNPKNEDGVPYKESLKVLEQRWFEETQVNNMNLKWYQRPTKTLLFLVLTLHTLSFTILMGPLVILMLQNICTKEAPTIIHHHGSGGMKMPTNKFKRMEMGGSAGTGGLEGCKNENSQEILSNVQSILSFISGILGILMSGKYGQLSDRFGRIFVLKILGLINLINSFCAIIYFHFFKQYHQFWMILLLSPGYFSGGIMTIIANGNSYLNDIVTPQHRAASISVLMSLVYCALGIGPLIGSLIVKHSGNNMIPLFFSIGFGGISTLLSFSVLKESRHPEALRLSKELYQQRSIEPQHSNMLLKYIHVVLNSVSSFFTPLKSLWLPKTETGSLIHRVNVLTLLFVDNFNMAVTIGTMSPIILFSIWKYNWTSVDIGYYMSIGGFGKAFVLLVFAPTLLSILTNRCRFNVNPYSVDSIDRFTILSSLIFVSVSLLVVICINDPSGVYISSILQSLGGMISPVTQSAIAKYSNVTNSGEIFGAIALVRHVSMLIFPPLFLQIYSHSIKFSAKFFLFVPLVVSLMTIAVSLFGLKQHKEFHLEHCENIEPLNDSDI